MADVFISYKSEDQDRAIAIIKEIEGIGIDCWISCRNVRGGKDFADEIVKAIKSCKVMIVVTSNQTKESHNVRRELHLAGSYNKDIIPYIVEDLEDGLPFEYYLTSAQGYRSSENGIIELLNDLCEKTGHRKPRKLRKRYLANAMRMDDEGIPLYDVICPACYNIELIAIQDNKWERFSFHVSNNKKYAKSLLRGALILYLSFTVLVHSLFPVFFRSGGDVLSTIRLFSGLLSFIGCILGISELIVLLKTNRSILNEIFHKESNSYIKINTYPVKNATFECPECHCIFTVPSHNTGKYRYQKIQEAERNIQL